MTKSVETQRQKIGRYGALVSWANTVDRTARTRNARASSPGSIDYWLARLPEQFENATEDARIAAAEAAKRAHFQRLARSSAKTRQANARGKRSEPTPPPLPEPRYRSGIEQATVTAARALGWRGGNLSESRLALELDFHGWKPGIVIEQYRVDRYRIDFAIPALKLAIEADGWVHTSATVAERDKARDQALAESGWTTVRIDTDSDDMRRQVQRLIPARTETPA